MPTKSKHAFGSEARLDQAIQNGILNQCDIIFLDEGQVAWINKNGKLIRQKDSGATATQIKYEITSKPSGALVNYFDGEIRVLCPADTQWVKQNVGATGNANMYYMGFKAYAPVNAVSFKESEQGVVVDEMFYFENNEFAGIDEHGRNYSIVWLPLASYDESTGEWSYFGAKSTADKYIGWTYVVEWYDANGVMISSDSVRINLSNEDCHFVASPYYVTKAVNDANTYTDEKIAQASVTVVEF